MHMTTNKVIDAIEEVIIKCKTDPMASDSVILELQLQNVSKIIDELPEKYQAKEIIFYNPHNKKYSSFLEVKVV